MAVTPAQKALTKAKKLTHQRLELAQQKDELERDIKKLGTQIMEQLDAAGEKAVEIEPGVGYTYQKPLSEVWNQEAVRNHLAAHGDNKLISKVFVKIESFDKKALMKLIQAEAIDDADGLLKVAVNVVESTPRLMPMRNR